MPLSHVGTLPDGRKTGVTSPDKNYNTLPEKTYSFPLGNISDLKSYLTELDKELEVSSSAKRPKFNIFVNKGDHKKGYHISGFTDNQLLLTKGNILSIRVVEFRDIKRIKKVRFLKNLDIYNPPAHCDTSFD